MDDNKPAEATGGQEVPVTPVNDNPPPIEPPPYKYEEINKPEMGEIARSEAPVAEKPVVEEKPVVDQEAISKQIAEDAVKAVLEQQKAEAAVAEEAGKTEKPIDNLDEKLAQELWDLNKRDPTYTEALNFLAEKAAIINEYRQAEKVRVQEEEAEKSRQATEEENKRVNTFVDDELSELYRGNKLTKIQDPNNPSDQGVVERKSLFTRWAEINNDRRSKGLPEIISATRIATGIDESGVPYWKKPNAQPAGENAPVMGSRSSSTSPDAEQEYTNADLKRPWSFWKRS